MAISRHCGRRSGRKASKDINVLIRTPVSPKHYIYKITVDDKFYIGYTERNVDVRCDEHLRSAKRGQTGKFYDQLRQCDYAYHIDTVAEFDDCYWALVEEIKLIASNPEGLNSLPGGTSKAMTVVSFTDGNGEIQYQILEGDKDD